MEVRTIDVGVLLDSDRLPAWLYESIEGVSRLEGVKLFRIDCSGFEPRPGPGRILGLISKFDLSLTRSLREPDAFSTRDVSGLMSQAAARLTAGRREEDLGQIAALRPSMLIDCTDSVLGDDIASAATHGVWRHIHSVSGRESRVPDGFWEALRNDPVVASELVMQRQDGTEVVLERTWTTSYKYSLSINLNAVLWSSSLFLARAIRHHIPRGDRVPLDIERGKSILDDSSIPSITDLARWLCLFPWRIATTWLYEKRYWDRWYLKYRLGDDLSLDLHQYVDMLPPRGDFWADPHIIFRDGIYYIFIEVYTSRRDLGHLAVIEMDESGHWTAPQDVLIEDYHLSYPHLVDDGDHLYMIPETKENHSVQIYECVRFPLQWELKMRLMEDVEAVDSTLIRRDGRWWLFVVKSENHVRTTENLYLYYSDELLSSDWTPHRQNPVVSDARRARPGGTIIEHDGKLLRPAQDCSWDYGYALRVFEIVTLDETSYEEVEVSRFLPDWSRGAKGIHTLAKVGDLTIVDCLEGSVGP